MKVPALLSLLSVAFASLFGSGCAHMVHIESAPGAEIYVNDQKVGVSPTNYQETTGNSDPVKVTVKKNGKERTVMVPRTDVDMGAVGAGAAAGVGGCLASNLVLGIASFVFFPAACLFPVSWAMLGAGPGYGWYYGHKMPDNVHIDLEGGGPAVAEAPRDEPAAASPPSGSLARY